MAESMKGLKRTCKCAELSTQNIGQTVTVMGWVQKNRIKGGIIFVDLRDRSGLIQIIFDESITAKDVFDKAYKLRSEFVIAVTGKVNKRA
ncbi:MAG: Asp-tRNA(Asn)/Glu-tRNA(Gln) amidotransferase GatCAB subunit C, partial [Butyrivibrio sp.]|nr:Asp-tRNA(Asn)/Glu-tRNA(Gln) amidotransferase GatCAB subunit C [Butyrivibrio sp.]